MRGLTRLVVDDGGQDLIEYALLSGFIATTGLLVFPEIAARMSDAYADWISQANEAWEPCPPAPAACP